MRLRAVLGLAVAGLAAIAAAPAPAATSLELIPPDDAVALVSRNGHVLLDLGVLVAPVGGDFELRVRRDGYGLAPTIVQVDAQTGAVVRNLPASAPRRWLGLRRFFQVTVRSTSGKVVAERYFRFCPNGADRWAVGDGEPAPPRYPDTCDSGSPFVLGMVWGVEDGWAVSAFGFLREPDTRHYAVQLAGGAYTAEVRIAEPYRQLLEIPPESAEASVAFTVVPAGAARPSRSEPRRDDTRRAAGTVVPPDLPDPDPNLLPDLVALPAWNVELVESLGGRNLLTFAASPWNAGPGPLVVEGFRRPSEEEMDAFQYFYEGGEPVGRTPAGSMVWDARKHHNHWHFLQFSRYSLIDSRKGTVVRSRKQSFCLAPTEPVDLTVPGAAWTPWSLPFASVCGGRNADWLRQAMPAGWSDTYFQIVAGQAFDVTSVPNGRYQIEIEVNPWGTLHERTASNNIARRTVILSGTRASRRVRALPWHSIKN